MLTENNVLQTQYQFSEMEKVEKQKLRKNKQRKKSSKEANSSPKGFYYNIQVIRKVATFLENVKMGAVRQHIDLKPQDLSYISNQQEQQENDQNLFRYDNRYIVFIEIIVLLASLFCLWKNSYELIFGQFQKIAFASIPALVIQIAYKFIYMNTQLKNEKLQIISTRKQILKNYLHNFIIFDLLYFLGSILQRINSIYIFYPSKLMGLCIIVTFISISDKLENIFAKTSTLETLMSIIKLLVKIMVFIHFLSLMFNFVAIIEKENGTQTTWIQFNFEEQLSDFQKYINGWYWGSTILSTVGFGDITPANVSERAFISFVEVFCCAMFGYCVNYIGTMIGLFGQSKATYEKDIRRLNYYLKSVQIPEKLKNEIRSHFYNKYQIQQVYNPQAQEYLFSKFTDKITSEVKQSNNLNIITQSQPLHIFSDELINKLAASLNKAVYAPSQLIFEENSNNSKLFIVQQGQINQIPSNQKFMKKLKPLFTFNNQDSSSKNTFGWFNFITGQKYTTCAKASKFSIVYELLRDDFLKIVKEFKNDYFKFLQIKQKLTINPVNSIKQCVLCGRYTHNISHCPRIHFIPKNISSLLLFEKKKSTINYRKYYKRALGFKTKLMYPMQQFDQYDQILENENTDKLYVSKKRVSIDKLPPSRFQNFARERLNTVASNKRNSSLLRKSPQMKQLIQLAQNGQSSSSINVGTSNGFTLYRTMDQTPQISSQIGPKSKKIINKLDRVLLDETQNYFPSCHINKILGNMPDIDKNQVKKLTFVIEKQLSNRFREKNNGSSHRKMLLDDQLF